MSELLVEELKNEEEHKCEEDRILRRKEFKNGTTVIQYRDGRREQKTCEGVTLVVFPNGRQVQTDQSSGIEIELRPDGTKIQRNLNDKSTIELLSDGTRMETRSNGTRIVVSPEGIVTETRVNGVVIKLFPDGRKEQLNPGSQHVLRLSSNDSDEEVKDIEDSALPNVVQTLRVLSNGTHVQINEEGEWQLLVRRINGETVQRGHIDPSTTRTTYKYLFSTETQRILIEDGKQTSIDLKSQERKSSLVDSEILEMIVQTCAGAERACNLVPKGMQMQLALAETALVSATKEFELQMSALKNKAEGLRKQNEFLKQQLSQASAGLNGLSHKPSVSASDSNLPVQPISGSVFEISTETSELKTSCLVSSSGSGNPKTAHVDSVNTKKSSEDATRQSNTRPICLDAGTQWTLRDAQSQFLKRQVTKEIRDSTEEMYGDPHLARAIVTELKSRIMVLEDEKQEVEDRLIDLRFSLQSESHRKKQTILSRLLPMLSFSQRKSKPPADAALTRTESLLAVIANIKQRQEKTSGELSMKRRESVRLASEALDLRHELDRVTKERNDAMEKAASLQDQINSLSVSPEFYYFSSSDDDDRASISSISLLPSIEEEIQTQISLSPVSPMI